LIELTMVVPILMLLTLGMLETGIAWRDHVTVTQSARQGARVGSHLAQQPGADQEALKSVMAVLAPETGRVDFVVIYEANGNGDLPNPTCLTQSVSGVCNWYGQTELTHVNDSPAQWAALDYDADWDPVSRLDSLTNPDHLGVHVQFDRPWVTNIFPGDGLTLTGKTVMRIEPEPG
jgi:hypothetical protein